MTGPGSAGGDRPARPSVAAVPAPPDLSADLTGAPVLRTPDAASDVSDDVSDGGSEDVTAEPGRAARRGTRIRAGNAMGRTRGMVLDAAGRLVAERGTRKTSMTDIAVAAGVAKGTLYNHFRSKEEVLAGLVEAEVRRLAEECEGLPLAEALTHAARRAGTHPAVRRLAAEEPSVLAGLYLSTRDGSGWRAARAAAAAALSAAGRDPDAAELIVRWIATHAAGPDRRDAVDTARLLESVLPTAPGVVPAAG